MERNPVRAGLVDYAWKWPHSSAKFYCLGTEDRLTVSDPMWDKGTGERGHKQYQEWLSEEVEGETKLFRNAGQALGREGFLARLVRVGDRDMPRPQDRPRK